MHDDSLIDAETRAFIRRTEAAFPPDASELSVAEQRRLYDEMSRSFFRGYPPGVTAEDRPAASVPCRIYPGARPTVLNFHGGGVLGGLDCHDDICAEIRARTGLAVVSADYRLALEHDREAAFADCRAVTRALAGKGSVILAGDSEGGTHTAAVSHALRAVGLPILGQVLIYPSLGGNLDAGSGTAHADAPMLTREDVLAYRRASGKGAATPARLPLQDRDFTGLPPSVVFSAECDPLCDDGPAYAARIRAAGGRAHAVVEPGLVHGYLRARASATRAADSFTRICNAVSALARGDWPNPLEAP